MIDAAKKLNVNARDIEELESAVKTLENEIFVFRPNGERFSSDKLSKGTFDQLYMSIRIDLA
ncbi:MAG: hypothetical protein QXE05_06025 [Nitrososphaeria archaeon]